MTADLAVEAKAATAWDGAPLHYEVAGAGEPIVFLHGAYASRFFWRFQRDALAEEFRILARDLRGHDGSPSVAPEGFGFDSTEVADMSAVLDAEGISRAHFVGHSTGGTIALFYALKHPDRVGRLVLLEPTLLSFAPFEVWTAGDWLQSMERGRRDGGMSVIHSAMAAFIGPDWREKMSPRWVARMEAQAAIAQAHMEAWDRTVVTGADLRALRAQALVLYGENGVNTQPYIHRAIRRARPDIECRTVPGTGHNLNIDRPDEVSAAIREFLKRKS